MRRTGLGHCQRPHALLHEQCFGMRRGSEDLDAAGGQIDDKQRVLRDEAGGEALGADGALKAPAASSHRTNGYHSSRRFPRNRSKNRKRLMKSR